MLDSVKRLFSKDASGFEKAREKVKELIKRLSKSGEKKDNTEILEIFEDYGVDVAPYRKVFTKTELKDAAEELGCPVMVKPITTKVITRAEAKAVIRVDSAEEADKAYAQVIGRIVSSTPWVGVTGVLVQELIPEEDKLSISWQREKKRSFPFKWIRRFLKGDREESKASSKEELISQVEGLPPNLQEVVSACHLVWIENPELSSMEVDIVAGPQGCKVVDARVSIFG